MKEKRKNPYAGRFLPGTDYERAFKEEVTQLVKRDMPLRWRNQEVEDLTEAYFEQSRKVPDSLQLFWLANYILRDDLKDRCPDKLTRTDFPFLSKGQTKLRMNRERPTGDMGYVPSTGRKPRIKPKKYRHMQREGA
ncbi:hypothetical protein H1S01_15700 [Heliobacterium chlorum]|uniref:Uncharacterized protein n=1 Tax=Heliobacterium chlorum TaxID=2698 RepID=A0ABR7T581_HELCL|nr:hypothetical protein [Heliobacterium chlorum]MBC9785930.1 hypothetical protein [Heliobacterium chlorum]